MLAWVVNFLSREVCSKSVTHPPEPVVESSSKLTITWCGSQVDDVQLRD